jgi:hypothetical protein
MTITLDLPPETESSLMSQANSRGLSIQDFVMSLLAKQAQDAPASDADQIVDDIFDTVSLGAGIGRDVLIREQWYR